MTQDIFSTHTVWQETADDFVRDLGAIKKREGLAQKPGPVTWFKKACLRFKGREDRQEGTLSYCLVRRSQWVSVGVLNGYRHSPLPPDLHDYRELAKEVAATRQGYQQEVDAFRASCLTAPAFKDICAAAQAANMRIEVEGGVAQDDGISSNIYCIQQKVVAYLSLRIYTQQPYSASSHLSSAQAAPARRAPLY